jgi:hypothetical protein
MTHAGISGARVLEPTLRMKAQANSSSRGQKDFMLEKRRERLHWWGMQGDPETSGSGWRLGIYGLFEYCLRAEMSLRCRQTFPEKERCLLDHLSPFGTSCRPSFRDRTSFFLTVFG